MSIKTILADYESQKRTINDLLQHVIDYTKRTVMLLDRRIDAEDVAQQVVTEVWFILGKGERVTSSLLYTIVKRRTIDAQRKYSPVEEQVDMVSSSLPEPGEWQERAHRIAREVLGEEIAKLVEREYTAQEISELLDIPASTIRARIQKVRRMVDASSKQAA